MVRTAENIMWDTDGVSIDDLPETVAIPADEDDNGVADYLSDVYGYCVESFTMNITYEVGDKVRIKTNTNIFATFTVTAVRDGFCDVTDVNGIDLTVATSELEPVLETVEFKTVPMNILNGVTKEATESVQEIFFDGDGVIPVNILANLIFNFREELVKTDADIKWPDKSAPQIRFKLKVTRDDADTIVANLNEAMEEADLPESNGQWWLTDEDDEEENI